MSTHYGPRTIDGLILRLDAKAYSGTGTTWYDLSTTKSDGTLVNGPTYDPANEGSIVFDGINDYVEIPDKSVLKPSEVTFCCFVNSSNIRDEEVIAISYPSENGNNGTNGFRFLTRAWLGSGWSFWPTAGAGTSWQGSALSNNTWYFLAVTHTATDLKMYKNGVLDFSTTNPVAVKYNTTIRLGDGIGSVQRHLQGKLSLFMMFNRALSEIQINEIFNLYRGRFGL